VVGPSFIIAAGLCEICFSGAALANYPFALIRRLRSLLHLGNRTSFRRALRSFWEHMLIRAPNINAHLAADGTIGEADHQKLAGQVKMAVENLKAAGAYAQDSIYRLQREQLTACIALDSTCACRCVQFFCLPLCDHPLTDAAGPRPPAGPDHHEESEAALQRGGLDPRVSRVEFTSQLVLQHALQLQRRPKREVRWTTHSFAQFFLLWSQFVIQQRSGFCDSFEYAYAL